MGQKFDTQAKFKRLHSPNSSSLRAGQKRGPKYQLSPECLFESLPFELLELVLVKSALREYRTKLMYLTEPSRDVYQSLAPVCMLWRETLSQRRRFANALNNYVSYPFRRTPHLLASFTVTTECFVRSVAHLDGVIYIVSCNHHSDLDDHVEMCVFECEEPYKKLDSIVVDGFSPWDLATGVTIPKRLYATDMAHCCVWRIKPLRTSHDLANNHINGIIDQNHSAFGRTTEERANRRIYGLSHQGQFSMSNTDSSKNKSVSVERWTSMDDRALPPFTISTFLSSSLSSSSSVSSEPLSDCILILVEHPSCLFVFREQEHRSASKIVKQEIALPLYLVNVRSAVATLHGTFVVSYGGTGGRSSRGVCEVSASGDVLRACVDLGKDELRAPGCLLLVPGEAGERISMKDGATLILADLGFFSRGRVTLLNSKLGVCRVLLHFVAEELELGGGVGRRDAESIRTMCYFERIERRMERGDEWERHGILMIGRERRIEVYHIL